jgi:hypothetical protein
MWLFSGTMSKTELPGIPWQAVSKFLFRITQSKKIGNKNQGAWEIVLKIKSLLLA